MTITKPLTQNLQSPIGLGTAAPSFSYTLQSAQPGDRQTACRILAASSPALLAEGKADLWDSGRMEREENYAIPYAGAPLAARQGVYWQAMAWDAQGRESPWSTPAYFELGLLAPGDWQGAWIGRGDDFAGDRSAALALTGSFAVDDPGAVQKARLYISGLGLFTAALNGEAVSDNLYEPGESEYARRVFYVAYDLLPLLRRGENRLLVTLGNGQYVNYAVDPVMALADGTLAEKHRYQKNDSAYLRDGICGGKKLLAQVELIYPDGRVEVAAASGESWKITESPVTLQNWYGGEDYDARRACLPAPAASLENARLMQPPKGRLAARECPPIRIAERWPAKSVTPLANGNWLVDFGKNSAGFVWLHLTHTERFAGRQIELYPAELLKPDGSGVDQASCTQSCDTRCRCRVMDSYVLAGAAREDWHPHFCYHGYQYVEVAGFPGEPAVENFEGCAVRLMNEKHADFETSSPVLNAISQMTDRSIESNMMFSFTDCPQIEKLGWLETTQLMFSSLVTGYDIRGWVPKIVDDMRDAQVSEVSLQEPPMARDARRYPGFPFDRLTNRETEDPGFVPGIAPTYFRIGGLYRDPNWGGACILTPWYDYLEYGDSAILRENFAMMRAYLGHLARHTVDGVLSGYAQMGEWGQLHEATPTTLVATCAFYLQTVTLADIAAVLGQPEVEAACRTLAARTQAAFYANAECWQPAGEVYGNGSQASYGCALFCGIVRPENRAAALRGLLDAVAAQGGHLTSGEVGLKQVFCALADAGENETVYRMVTNPTAPSYRYFVDQGLTTLPEYWNYTELWNGLGRSRNHAMMGHVKEWLMRYVLGVTPLAPGYRRLRIKPWLNQELSRVQGSVFTVRGSVRVDCRREGAVLSLCADIPVGASADVYIPFAPGKRCLQNGVPLPDPAPQADGYLLLPGIPSGRYCWQVV